MSAKFEIDYIEGPDNALKGYLLDKAEDQDSTNLPTVESLLESDLFKNMDQVFTDDMKKKVPTYLEYLIRAMKQKNEFGNNIKSLTDTVNPFGWETTEDWSKKLIQIQDDMQNAYGFLEKVPDGEPASSLNEDTELSWKNCKIRGIKFALDFGLSLYCHGKINSLKRFAQTRNFYQGAEDFFTLSDYQYSTHTNFSIQGASLIEFMNFSNKDRESLVPFVRLFVESSAIEPFEELPEHIIAEQISRNPLLKYYPLAIEGDFAQFSVRVAQFLKADISKTDIQEAVRSNSQPATEIVEKAVELVDKLSLLRKEVFRRLFPKDGQPDMELINLFEKYLQDENTYHRRYLFLLLGFNSAIQTIGFYRAATNLVKKETSIPFYKKLVENIENYRKKMRLAQIVLSGEELKDILANEEISETDNDFNWQEVKRQIDRITKTNKERKFSLDADQLPNNLQFLKKPDAASLIADPYHPRKFGMAFEFIDKTSEEDEEIFLLLSIDATKETFDWMVLDSINESNNHIYKQGCQEIVLKTLTHLADYLEHQKLKNTLKDGNQEPLKSSLPKVHFHDVTYELRRQIRVEETRETIKKDGEEKPVTEEEQALTGKLTIIEPTSEELELLMKGFSTEERGFVQQAIINFNKRQQILDPHLVKIEDSDGVYRLRVPLPHIHSGGRVLLKMRDEGKLEIMIVDYRSKIY
ncbi:MAG: hypothetical protein V1858_02890 [Candidatus Gottesmanbacteria bacterium]